MPVITLAMVVQLAQILSGLGGAGVAFDTLVEKLRAAHSATPQAPLPVEHVSAVKVALNDWAIRSMADKARAALRQTAGELRAEANYLDISANELGDGP